MAEVEQLATAGVTGGTFADFTLLEGGGVAMMPAAHMAHRGAFVLAAQTGTDTANLRLTLPLPNNLVWQLRTFHCVVEDSAGWNRGDFELFYAPTTQEDGNSTELVFPLQASAAIASSSTADSIRNFVFAISDDADATAGAWVGVLGRGSGMTPMDLMSFNDGTMNAVVALRAAAAAPVAGVCRFAQTWLGYTFEQMRSSYMWAGFNNRN